MIDRPCPAELELERAVSEGAAPELASHLEECEVCRGAWADIVKAIELARELPVAIPSAHRREEIRTAMLAAWDPQASLQPPRRALGRRAWAIAALAAAATGLVVTIFEVRRRPPAPGPLATHPRRGAVHPHEGTTFTLAAQPPDEIVRLRDGVLDIDVEPLAPGERFRVVVGADQVEVRGTSFEVVAAADQLQRVHVVHGRVEVARARAAPIVLGAGEAWSAPTEPVAAAAPRPQLTTESPSPPARARHVGTRARPALPPGPIVLSPTPQTAATPQEAAFVRAWEGVRQGDFGAAASSFAQAAALAPEGALAEDAAFWRAVAVARLHRAPEAIAAFRRFLDAYPASARAGEASAILGWLLVEAGDLEEARRRFHAAENDPNVTARSSARQGLEILSGRATWGVETISAESTEDSTR